MEQLFKKGLFEVNVLNYLTVLTHGEAVPSFEGLQTQESPSTSAHLGTWCRADGVRSPLDPEGIPERCLTLLWLHSK